MLINVLATNNPFQFPPPAPTVATPEPSLPNRDDIRVEYHRNSGRPTLTPIYAFEDYKREKNKVDPKLLSDAAWRPFNTRLDFEVAEFAHKTHLSEPSLARLLDLFRRGTSGKEVLTFETPADVFKAWDRANIYHVPVRFSVNVIYVMRSYIRVSSPKPALRSNLRISRNHSSSITGPYGIGLYIR